MRFEPVAQAHPDFHRVAQSEERRVHRAKGRRMAAGDDSGLGSAKSDFGIPRDREERRARSQIDRGQGAGRRSVITKNLDRAKAGQAGTIAFYAARMGTFYSEQLTRFGFGDEVRTIKQAWDSGGSKAGTEAVSRRRCCRSWLRRRCARARASASSSMREAGADVCTRWRSIDAQRSRR